MKPILYLFRGLPGSGKSTAASKIGCKVSEADQYFYKGGEYRFDPTRLIYAHKWCQTDTRRYLSCDLDVAVANTFTTLKELKPYLDMKDIAEVVVYKCVGDYKSIHDVPQETISRMRARWQDFEGEKVYEV